MVFPARVLSYAALIFIFWSYICTIPVCLICSLQRIWLDSFISDDRIVFTKFNRLTEYKYVFAIECYRGIKILPYFPLNTRNRSVNVLLRICMIFITPQRQESDIPDGGRTNMFDY